MHALAYFLSPFPSRKGFSAYRFPGPLAQVPFFLALSCTGFLLCGPKPLLLAWMLAGLYLGRDMAILCHYALVLLPVVWAGMFVVMAEAKQLEVFGRLHPSAGIWLTLLVLLVQAGVAWRSAARNR
jgi:hypothetical protein